MKKTILTILVLWLGGFSILYGQTEMFEHHKVQAINVFMSKVNIMGREALRAVKDSSVKAMDEPTFIRVTDADFRNGIIEVKVLSRLLKRAPEYARGFIGIAFHISDSNTKYESIYIRPANGRANDQVRRNHSIQYYAYPDYKFDTLRKIAPEKYESYADMALNQWITMRIEVKDSAAKLFLNNNRQPSLIVNDLKRGANTSGAVALWVEAGTEGYFSHLKIIKDNGKDAN